MLKLSTKGRYATRIMIRLAQSAKNHSLQRNDISRAEDMSPHYVEQILIRLKSAGLVKSTRGINGGFTVAKPPQEITMYEVLKAVEGASHLAPCLSEPCVRSPVCAARPIWQRADAALKNALAETTLADAAAHATELEGKGISSFDI